MTALKVCASGSRRPSSASSPLAASWRPSASLMVNSIHPSFESLVPPGKECPTPRFLTTTSKVTGTPAGSSAAVRSSAPASTTAPTPASAATRSPAPAPPPPALAPAPPTRAAKISMRSRSARRNSSIRRTVAVSPLRYGSAVLAPRKRWERTIPFTAATSPRGAGSSGMWQSWQTRRDAGR